MVYSDPNNTNSIVYQHTLLIYQLKTSHWNFSRAATLHLCNMADRGEKLQQPHCYHPFSDSMDTYLTKNHYENYSPKMVPTNPTGSWTNYKFGMFCQQWHPSVASGDADIRPRNVSRIHTCHLFMSEFCLVLSWGVIHRPPGGVLTRMGCVRMGRGVSPTWPGPAESWRTRGRYTPRLRLAVSSTQ